MLYNAKPVFLTNNITDSALASITASSTEPGYPVEYAVDGNTWRWWLAAAAGTTYLAIDAGAVVSADILGIGQHNLGTPGDTVTLQKGSASTVVSDAFDDSSFDTVNFGSVISGGGTVTETTSLATLSNTGAEAAIFYDKNTLVSRADQWNIRHDYKHISTGSPGVATIMLYESASPPALGANNLNLRTENKACIFQSGVGLYFTYRNTSGTLVFWDGSIWTTISAAATIALNTQYIARMYSDGVDIHFELWDSTDITLIASASVPLADMQVDGNTDYFLAGDIDNTVSGAANMVSTLWEHTLIGSFVDVIPAFTPAANTAFLTRFTSTTSQIWRLKIVTASVIPFIGFMKLGERLDIEKYINDGWDPHPVNPKVSTGRAARGASLGAVTDFSLIPLSIGLSNLTDAWVEDTLRPVMDNHIMKGDLFFIGWDLDQHATQVFIGGIPDGFQWNAPFTRARRATTIQMSCEQGL